MGKGYVCVKLQKESAKAISEVLDTLGVKGIESNKLHVTVMYDASNPDIEVVLDKNEEFVAKIIGVEELGTRGSKWEAIALVLECPDLEKKHKYLKSSGFKHSYPEYKCHMSLVYGPKSQDFDLCDLAYRLNAFPEELTFDSIKHEAIKD